MAKSMQYQLRPSQLRPTLWRTCRVLANRTKLRILAHLVHHPGQCVSQVATDLGLSVSIASQYLRSLNARGFLAVRRVGRWVYYSPSADPTVPEAGELLRALGRTFKARGRAVDTIFRLATAFTHPRRQEIYSTLHERPLPLHELACQTGISRQALWRHLTKLRDRGFVVFEEGRCRAVAPNGVLGRTLARLAAEPRP